MIKVLPTERARVAAGRALIAFVAIMIVLTLASRTLYEMTVPVVSAVAPQRGSLEKQIEKSGTLAPGGTLPVLAKDAARVEDIFVKVAQWVKPGDKLFSLNYEDVLKEKRETLISKLYAAVEAQQDFDWAMADLSTYNRELLEDRREALEKAEQTLRDKQAAGEDTKAAEKNVLSKKRSLEQLTAPRDYVKNLRALTAAKEALAAARDEYFDALKRGAGEVVPSDERDARISDAERTIAYGGAVDQLFPHPEGALIHDVLADAAGEVALIEIDKGAIAKTDEASIVLNDLSAGLLLAVTLTEDEAGELAVGDEAELLVSDDIYTAYIASIAPSKDEAGMYTAELQLPAGAYAAGMKATMKVKKRTQSYDALIPLSALRQDNDGAYVYVIDRVDSSLGAELKLRRVTVYELDRDLTRAAVQGGISMSDALAARSERSLADGDRVRLEE